MNRCGVFAAVLVLAAVAVPAAAQQVYRCIGAHGVVQFSQVPCGDDAEAMTIRAHTPSADDVERAARRARPTATGLDGELRLCLERARRNAGAGVAAVIADNNAQISRLQRVRANNNQAGAIYLTGIMQQIAALNEANAALRQTQSAEILAAEQLCRDERARGQDALVAAEAADRELEVRRATARADGE